LIDSRPLTDYLISNDVGGEKSLNYSSGLRIKIVS
jgi:hypothetical protein